MYNSVKFKTYINGDLNEHIIVEDINFVSNGINTATLSLIVNTFDDDIPVPNVGDWVRIYAYGIRFKGNDFSDTFLNKNINEYQQYVISNQPQPYELLIFAGSIRSINVDVQSNMFSYHFKLVYTFECVGVENILNHIGFDSYKFYDQINNTVITVAGMPYFDKNNYVLGITQCFTTNNEGLVWTRAKALVYLMQNLTLPFSGINVAFNYSASTFADLNSLQLSNVCFATVFEYIQNLCGKLFNYYFNYTESQGAITLHINIVSKATTSSEDLVSFLNLHGTAINSESKQPVERLVLRYPFVGKIDGFYQIFRHKDNRDNEQYYNITDADVNYITDNTDFEAVVGPFYKDKGQVWGGILFRLNDVPVPERYDEVLRNSLGSRLGVHRKYFVHPITTFLIMGDEVNVNIEDFEVISLNDFRLARNEGGELTPIPWLSKLPYADMTITMDGNQIEIECDIPHQIAPADRVYPHSLIPRPVFPINDGDYVYINADIVARNNKMYVYVGNGIDTKVIDIEYIPDNPLAMASYLYQFYSNPLSTFEISGTMLDWLIDYYFVYTKSINSIYLLLCNEGGPNPLSSTLDVRLLTSQFSITRNGAIYNFRIYADKGEVDLNELITNMQFAFEKPQHVTNTISIKGNYDREFYGEIKEVQQNTYVVLPEWAESETDTIIVARLDEHKLGYWLNVRPNDKIRFEMIDYNKLSERKEIIEGSEGEDDVVKINKIVPDEYLFPIILFRLGSGNVKTYYNVGASWYFTKFIDSNQYARSWAVVPDDEENVYG